MVRIPGSPGVSAGSSGETEPNWGRRTKRVSSIEQDRLRVPGAPIVPDRPIGPQSNPGSPPNTQWPAAAGASPAGNSGTRPQ